MGTTFMRDVLLTSLEGGSLKIRFFYWDILFQRGVFLHPFL